MHVFQQLLRLICQTQVIIQSYLFLNFINSKELMSWKCLFCCFCSDKQELQVLLDYQYIKDEQTITKLLKKIQNANEGNKLQDQELVFKIIKYYFYMKNYDKIKWYLQRNWVSKPTGRQDLQFKLIQFISFVKHHLQARGQALGDFKQLTNILKQYQKILSQKLQKYENDTKVQLGRKYMFNICQYFKDFNSIQSLLAQKKKSKQCKDMLKELAKALGQDTQKNRKRRQYNKQKQYQTVSKVWLRSFCKFMQQENTDNKKNYPFIMTHLQICYPNVCKSSQFFEIYPNNNIKISLLTQQQWNFIQDCFSGLLMKMKMKTKQLKNSSLNSKVRRSSRKLQANSNNNKERSNFQHKIIKQNVKSPKKQIQIQLLALSPKDQSTNQYKKNFLKPQPYKMQSISTPSTQIKIKQKAITIKRGIANMGNTCYMNSGLQCLHKTYELSTMISDYHPKKQYNLIRYLQKLNKELQIQSKDQKPIFPRQIAKMISTYNPQFRQNSQNDAGELVLTVLNMIHEQSNKIQKPYKIEIKYAYNKSDQDLYEEYKRRDQLKQKSILDQCITGRFKTTYKCKECTNQKRLFEKFNMIYLPIAESSNKKATINFHDCLENFNSYENIPDWKCQHCHQETPHVKSLQFFKMNKILIFCFKRFSFQGHKINAKLKVEILIDLGKYLKNKYYKQGDGMYQLYAAINHFGSLRSGHYTCFCQSPNESNWVQYDDSRVAYYPNLNLEDLSNAYILFYRLVK